MECPYSYRIQPYPVERFQKVLEFLSALEINILGTGFKVERNKNNQNIISPKAFLRDTLSKLWEDIEDKTDVFFILLDDLENLAAVSEILMRLKSALSTDSLMETKILVGLASTSTNWLEITSVQKHHPLSRYFLSRVELTSLTEKEVQETIREH